MHTSVHPDALTESAQRNVALVHRDTWLFLGTIFAAHAAVVINLVAVLS